MKTNTNTFTRIISPAMLLEQLLSSYSQNPYHVDMSRYFADEIVKLPNAEWILLEFLNKGLHYDIITCHLSDCRDHGRLEIILFDPNDKEDRGRQAYLKIARSSDHTWKIQDIRLIVPGSVGVIEGYIESVFGLDTKAEAEEIRANSYEIVIEDDEDDYFDEMPGFSVN